MSNSIFFSPAQNGPQSGPDFENHGAEPGSVPARAQVGTESEHEKTYDA
jgi:hypothetical protein